jgi:hypothetical protein
MAPTFGIPGSVVLDTETHCDRRAPPDDLGATVMISCTDDEARAMKPGCAIKLKAVKASALLPRAL